MKRTNTKIDWGRYAIQENEVAPKDEFEENDRKRVAGLSPELKEERARVIDKLCRIGQTYVVYGDSYTNALVREIEINKIRGKK